MERKSLESAAANYSYLRGLLSLPLGLLLILTALTNWEWGPLSNTWVFLVSMLVLGMAYLAITRYYSENYGRVTPSTKQQVRVAVATTLSVAVIWGGLILTYSADLPVNGTAAFFGLVMLAYYGITVGLRAHHMIIWGQLVVAGLLPVWGGLGEANAANVGFLLAGVAAMATGIFDHRLLVRTFGSYQGVNLENGDVGA